MSKKRGVKGWIKLKLIEAYQGKCQYCGEPGTTFDHIIPTSKGGERGASNMTLACETCNGRKSNRLLPDKQQEYLIDQAERRVIWMKFIMILRRFDVIEEHRNNKKRRARREPSLKTPRTTTRRLP